MASRLITNAQTLAVGQHTTTAFRVSRATKRAVMTVISTLSAASTGTSTLSIAIRHIANPGVTTGLVATEYEDTNEVENIVVDQDEATAGFQENFFFPTEAGVYDVRATVTGPDTFLLTLWLSP